MRSLEEANEEFNNFMHRVTEVSEIVQKLKSTDKNIQKMGELEADRILKEQDRTILENIDENNVTLKIKSDRTVINHQAFKKIDPPDNPNEMSQEAFKDYIEKDCEQRYQDRKIRREKADTFKTQALKAFRRGEYEKALSCYNKAIEQVRDSCALYLNRALTHINLGLLEKAQDDIKCAQRLNEDSLKSWLLLAKISFLKEDEKNLKEAVKEAKERNPEQIKFIDEYIDKLKNEQNDCNN